MWEAKKMKKIFTLTLTMMMGLSMLVGCSIKEDQLTIGIVQIVEHTSLDMIRESLVEELEAKGIVDGQNVKIDYQNAQGDQSNLNSICKKFVGDGVDVIVAISTPSAQAAAAATSCLLYTSDAADE